MIDIQPQYVSLNGMLKNRLFQIPEYQRAYSWTSHERTDLFNDIQRELNREQPSGHFMATVVGLRTKTISVDTDDYQVLEVVDGQQRITTLIILLKCISLALDIKSNKEKKLLNELSELLVKSDGELLLLQTNHDSSHYFSNFMRTGESRNASEAKTLADAELLRAIHECKRFAGTFRTSESTLKLAAFIKNKLFFLLHEIADEKAVYSVFEVLNSRGLTVSWLDRLKSYLMAAAFELPKGNKATVIKELHSIWRDIYATIGLRQGFSTEALRFAATLAAPSAPSRPMGEEESVEYLRSLATSAKSIRATASRILDVTKACDEVLSDTRRNAVTRISQARLLAVALHLKRGLKTEDRENLYRRWESVSFRIYGIAGKDARSKVGDFTRLAWGIANDEQLDGAKIRRSINALGSDHPIEEVLEELRGTDCYQGWEPELRYLMFRYEEHLAKSAGQKFSNEQWSRIWDDTPSKSIEHIWPQSKAPEKHRHRLGNLVLLPPGLNSKLSNSPVMSKIDEYRKCGLLIAIDVAERAKGNKWNGREIVARENDILAWAQKEWA